MLLKQTKSRFIFCSLILVLSTLINGCNNSQKLADFLRADPSLEPAEKKAQSTANSGQKSNSNTQNQTKKEGIQINKSPKKNSDTKTAQKRPFADLPENLPFYPQASLKLILPQSTPEEGSSEWRSPDDPNTIVNYYREKWESSQWQIVQPFRANQNKSGLDAVVRRDGLDFKIDLAIAKPTAEDSKLETRLKISYQATDENELLAAEELKNGNLQEADSTEKNPSKQTDKTDKNNQAAIPVKNQSNSPNNNDADADADADAPSGSQIVPEQLLSYVRDVTALGITDSPDLRSKKNKVKLNPNETITRREYARWLFTANNIYYADVPGNKIRLASTSNELVFKDIRVQDSDFEEIQGLAEAGIIPSILTNDSSNILFEPDDPLTREDLMTWKVPLDTRRGLPKADANSIQEAWGFQDTNQINVLALRALFADYQNGDQSNLKRVFGYTTLFQPKKVVTKAEAAASLWYLGFQGDGVSAQDKLKSLKSSE